MIRLEKKQIIYEDSNGEKTVVSSVIPFLNNIVDVSSDFTLEDFFNIIKKEPDVFQLIFDSDLGRFPIKYYIEDCDKQCPLDDKANDVLYLELYWDAEVFDNKRFYEKIKKEIEEKKARGEKLTSLDKLSEDLKDPGNDIPDIEIGTGFHGWGVWDSHPFTKEENVYGGIAIEYTPIYQIKHLSIILNEIFIFYDLNDSSNILCKGIKKFSVYEFFSTILNELSFMGSPENRDKTYNELIEKSDEMTEDMKYEEGNEEDNEEKNEEDRSTD